MHDITITTRRRQLGRSRITDYFWRCSCGDVTTAPTGFSTREQAETNGLFHRRRFISPRSQPSTLKENRAPMSSQARRTVESLEAARENTKLAVSAMGQHRHRGERGTLPQHITDMADLVETMVTIHGITADLAAVAKTCADDVRARYVSGLNPTSGSWPEPLKQAASDGYRALTRLRQHLTRTPAQGSHDTLAILHGFLQDVHRATAQH